MPNTSKATFILPAKRLLLAATLLLSASAVIQAQTAPYRSFTPTAANTAGDSYFGLYGGPSDFSRSNGGTGNFAREDHTTAYGVAVGKYLPGQNIGMELGYTNFGEVARAGGTTKAEGIHLSLVGRLPVNQNFNLLGKIGTTYGHTDVSSNAASGVTNGSAYGFDWSYGIGAEVVITPQWSGVLQYGEHYMKFAGDRSDRVTATAIGVRMHF